MGYRSDSIAMSRDMGPLSPLGVHPMYHPGRIHYKTIPWNILFCNDLCNYYKKQFHQNICFVMLLPLVCPCLPENMRRNLLCKEIVCNFYKINCAKTISFRVVKTVFLENGAFVPCRKQVVSRKMAKMTILHSTRKNKGLCSSDTETDEK